MSTVKQWNGSAWVEVALQSPIPTIDNSPRENVTTATISSGWAYTADTRLDGIEARIPEAEFICALYLGAL